MTQKEWLKQAQKKVEDNLQLWTEHGYVRVDDSNRRTFFYKQVNHAVGALVAYVNSHDSNGRENKHYDNHCFDLFLYTAASMDEAITCLKSSKDSALPFWIPSFNPYNERYIAVVNSLDEEKETNPILLDEKYKEISGRNF